MKTVACIVARTNSKRLPNKVLKNISYKTVIEHIIERVKIVNGVDEIYIATSHNKNDLKLGDIAKKNNIQIFYGSELSVISRLIKIGENESADNIIRVTGDNIFTDSFFLEKQLYQHKIGKYDYSRVEKLSIGITAEVINLVALKKCYLEIDENQSEYLFYYMYDPTKYKTLTLIPKSKELINPYSSLTLDTHEDLFRTEYVFKNINKTLISYKDIIALNSMQPIPNFHISPDLKINMPNQEKLDYKKFRAIINNRIKLSHVQYI